MATQTYATHRHNPKMTGIGLLFLVVAIVGFALRAYGVGGRREMMALGLFGLVACNFVLLFISRAYTTGLQDRIIKLEMRVRCASLLTPSQQATLARLDKAATHRAAGSRPTRSCLRSSNKPSASVCRRIRSNARSRTGFPIWIARRRGQKMPRVYPVTLSLLRCRCVLCLGGLIAPCLGAAGAVGRVSSSSRSPHRPAPTARRRS